MDETSPPFAKRFAIALIMAAVGAAAIWFGPASLTAAVARALGPAGETRAGPVIATAGIGLVVGYCLAWLFTRGRSDAGDWIEDESEIESEDESVRRRPLHIREELDLERQGDEPDETQDDGDGEAAETPVDMEEPEPETPTETNAPAPAQATATATSPAPAPAPIVREPLEGLTLPELRRRLETAIGEWRKADPAAPAPDYAPDSRAELKSALERLAALDRKRGEDIRQD